MTGFRKRVFAAAGGTSVFFGPGRKEFDPAKPMPPFESYLKDTALETLSLVPNPIFDEGIIGSFMSQRFLKQANLPGFLPFMVPNLYGKPGTGIEGACGTGGRAVAMAIRSILSDLSDSVFVAGFEMQNGVKSIYGADILAGASYYRDQRKEGDAFFFPGVFAKRAGAYYQRYGEKTTWESMARWYEQAILNARTHPKAQEYHNSTQDLYKLALTPPDPERFLPYINLYACSKITDGATSIVIASEEGLKKLGIPLAQAIEIVGMGEVEGDITLPPEDLTVLTQSALAVKKALSQAKIHVEDLGVLEVHDCFSITGLLMLEAIGVAKPGKAPEYVLEGNASSKGKLPTNLSGGLIGFGHPTGASGIRMLVDLQRHLLQKKTQRPFGLLVSMGGDDKTVTTISVRSTAGS